VISIEGLRKRFPGGLEVLRGIDLTIGDGEVVSLIGRSGSGKTTLLRCINFLEEYDDGEIRLDGTLLWYRTAAGGARLRMPEPAIRAQRQQMGIVFQQFNLFPHMTAMENVCLGPSFAHKRPEAEVKDLAQRLLERVGLGGKIQSYPYQLSGGEQQRVAIARALAMRPKVLLLDEITSALDPELVGEVLEVIRSLVRERMMMVIVTHELRFAREISHRVAYLSQGQIAEIGPPGELLDNPQDSTLKEFLRRMP
jgi:polar amino acid transport system ATP-binding protein